MRNFEFTRIWGKFTDHVLVQWSKKWKILIKLLAGTFFSLLLELITCTTGQNQVATS